MPHSRIFSGWAGYVGSHRAKALAAAGHDGVVLDSLLNGHRDFARWGKLIAGDIRDAATLDSIFAAHRFDAVMHLAALAYVGESVTAPDRYYDVNVNGTRVLLDAMMRAGVRAIVFSSSCAVYGEPERMPIKEDERLDPINPYGFTKLACERMMDDFGRAYGLKSVRLRYFKAGADPAAEIGERQAVRDQGRTFVFLARTIRRPMARRSAIMCMSAVSRTDTCSPPIICSTMAKRLPSIWAAAAGDRSDK
ncbi:MAG TPA: NAD-dependent epimerase/dehydratase family protein [Pseudolabrys sp.]|jgi:UDP-arabinose 4-epimerase